MTTTSGTVVSCFHRESCNAGPRHNCGWVNITKLLQIRMLIKLVFFFGYCSKGETVRREKERLTMREKRAGLTMRKKNKDGPTSIMQSQNSYLITQCCILHLCIKDNGVGENLVIY